MMHGHTKIELTNVHTGEVEVIEKDNIVTNAVNQIFNGFGGRINVQQLLTSGDQDAATGSLVSDFYGGLLLYDKALGSDPDTIFAPADAKIVGSCTYNVVNTGTNTVRGSFNKTESSINMDDGVATFVYDFATSQGNGTISSVCLTNARGGFFSETPGISVLCDGSGSQQYMNTNYSTWDSYFPLFRGVIGSDPTRFNGWPVYVDEDNNAILLALITSDKHLQVRKYEFPVATVDVFHKINTARIISEETFDVSNVVQTVQNGTFEKAYNFILCDAEHLKWYLICCPDYSYIKANQKINIREFDITTGAYTDYSITNNTGDQLGTKGSAHNQSGWTNGMCIYNGYLYISSYDGSTGARKQIYKIKLSDSTLITKIKMNGLSWRQPDDIYQGRIYCYTNGDPQYNGASSNAGVVLNTETDELYGIEALEKGLSHGTSFTVTTHIIPSIRQQITPYMAEGYWWDGSNMPNYGLQRVLRRNYLGTINDLPSPVEKTADKTMKITYTLRRS